MADDGLGGNMTRRWLIVVLVLVLTAAFLPTQGAAQTEGPPKTPDHMRAFSIVPPGQEGIVTSDEFAAYQAQGDHAALGVHYSDQLEMYASLIDDNDVTGAELSKYFHSMQFGPGDKIERTYQPTAGVTVYRDDLGIPHIYAESIEKASFALGYVTAEDRLFQMDVFRHAGRGTLTEFVGPGANDERLHTDIATRREGYTEAEVQKMFDDFDDKFGPEGATIQKGLQAYADGVNARIDELKTNPALFSERPVEYEATGNPFPAFPTEWTPVDTLFLVVLQLRVFGETAGFELDNAGLYAHLTKKHGKKLGTRIFNDMMFQNDPGSPTSIPKAEGVFRSQSLGRLDPKSVAIPDDAAKLAAETADEAAVREGVLSSLGFSSPASNALLVSARESKTGNPLEIGAPQVGYAVPAFFMDVDVHAPGVNFRGPAVPGASVLIPLGRGEDYAWSLTTGVSDAVDTRVELLCEPGGGEPTQDSNGYMFKGKCKAMESRDETFIVKPQAGDAPPGGAEPGPPRMEERTFYRTVHGPVFARGTVKDKPVALVKQRFFWKKEIDSIPPFYQWNVNIDDIGDFARAASEFTMSFNSFYADSKDIGYFHVGFYPKRTTGVHPSLPSWGTGAWEWKGRFPFSKQPQIINPKQGWVANWNNKPALGWSNFDDQKWGSVHRVQLIIDKMHKLLDGRGKAELSDIVDVIRDAATQDVRAVYLGRKMITMAKSGALDAKAKEGLQILSKWIGAGAHRLNKDRDETMDDSPALVLFDRWWDLLVHRVFDDELGEEGYGLMGVRISDYRPANGSSFFFDFSGWLKNLFARKTRARLARNYCDDLGTKGKESCAAVTLLALKKAIEELVKEQGEDMSKWTTPAENLAYLNVGAGTVARIPWQNRGTHNHIVELLSDY